MRPRICIGWAKVALIALALAACASLPLLARAATSDPALYATIRAAILSDPRSSGMSQTQIDAMADALRSKAEAQGMTVQDITWQPEAAPPARNDWASVQDSCGTSRYLCAFNTAFGFSDPDILVPIALGLSSAALLFVLASMMEARRQHPLGSVAPAAGQGPRA